MPSPTSPPSCPRGNHPRALSASPSPGAVNSGHLHCPRGSYVPRMFHAVQLCDDFASILGVPTAAVPLIVPRDCPCRSKGCPLNAIEGNGGYCPAHKRVWYPLIGECGKSLHGPEFLRQNGKFCMCDCSQNDALLQATSPTRTPCMFPLQVTWYS